MTYYALRGVQWGGPVLIIGLCHYQMTPPWLLVLIIIAIAWNAKNAADRQQSHRNMRTYIRDGGLERDREPIVLKGVRL